MISSLPEARAEERLAYRDFYRDLHDTREAVGEGACHVTSGALLRDSDANEAGGRAGFASRNTLAATGGAFLAAKTAVSRERDERARFRSWFAQPLCYSENVRSIHAGMSWYCEEPIAQNSGAGASLLAGKQQ